MTRDSTDQRVNGLERRVADHLEAEAKQVPLTRQSRETGFERITSRHRKRQQRSNALAVAAGVALVGSIAIVMFALAPSPTEIATVASEDRTPTTTSMSEDGSDATENALDWKGVSLPFDSSTAGRSIVGTRDGFVSIAARDGSNHLYHSTDGISWTSSPINLPSGAWGLTESGELLVAENWDSGSPEGTSELWTSEDGGLTWAELQLPERIAPVRDNPYLVDYVSVSVAKQGNTVLAARSSTLVPGLEILVLEAGIEEEWFEAHFENNELVLVVGDGPERRTERLSLQDLGVPAEFSADIFTKALGSAELWRSVDEGPWQQLQPAQIGLGSSATDLVLSAGNHTFLIQSGGSAQPIGESPLGAFVSTDGLDWEPVQGPPLLEALYSASQGVDGRWLSLSFDFELGGTGQKLFESNDDGRTWKPVLGVELTLDGTQSGASPDFFVSSLAQFNGGAYVVGTNLAGPDLASPEVLAAESTLANERSYLGILADGAPAVSWVEADKAFGLPAEEASSQEASGQEASSQEANTVLYVELVSSGNTVMALVETSSGPMVFVTQ